MSYSVLDNFKASQFLSRIVLPPEMPSICVWTAPEMPVVQRSWLYDIMLGAIAEGGGDLMFWSITCRFSL